MKTINHFKLFFAISAALVFVVPGIAQETKPSEAPPQNVEQRPLINPAHSLGTTTLRQLGVTDEQMQQIRKQRASTVRLSLDAYKRLREATQLLDEAVYADYTDDADIQNKLQKLQEAQAEVSKLRYANELAVRRILTSEQLVKFRELRQRYEEMRNERRKHRLNEFERQRPRKLIRPAVRPVREKPVL